MPNEPQKIEYLQFETENGSTSNLFKIPHTYEDVGAAPGDYGLGRSGKLVTSPDEATDSGFYCLGGKISENYFPEFINFAYGPMLVERRHSTSVKQTFYFDGISAIRYGHRNKESDPYQWGPLEFITPPMVLNTVYRTTERFREKPVYVKTIQFERLPSGTANNTYKDKIIAPTGKLIDALVRLDGYVEYIPNDTHQYSDKVPINRYTSCDFRLYGDNCLKATVSSGSNQSDWTAVIAVYFTLQN